MVVVVVVVVLLLLLLSSLSSLLSLLLLFLLLLSAPSFTGPHSVVGTQSAVVSALSCNGSCCQLHNFPLVLKQLKQHVKWQGFSVEVCAPVALGVSVGCVQCWPVGVCRGPCGS